MNYRDRTSIAVLPDDYGIRPAGKPDHCFYCNQKVGLDHLPNCVILHQTVRIRFIVELEVDEPSHWDKDAIEFKYNDGSWCADNFEGMLGRHIHQLNSEGKCLCGSLRAELVEVVDAGPFAERYTPDAPAETTP